MTLGEVLQQERERAGLAAEEAATRMTIGLDEYRALESGSSPAESWAPCLAQLAIELETPTARLLTQTGRSRDGKAGEAGPLIRRERLARGAQAVTIAQAVGLSLTDYETLESGESPIEQLGLQLLRFAEAIEQPVFNLFYPCGVPFRELHSY